jgi:hypothetical protein
LIASHEAIRSGNLDAAIATSRSVLERATSVGYQPFVCWARLLLGVVAERAGSLDEASKSLRAALELARGLSLPHYVSIAQSLLGDVAARSGDPRSARSLVQDALNVAEAAGAPWFGALARVRLARLLEMEGEDAAACALYADVVQWGDASDRGPARESFFITIAGDPYADALIGLGAEELREGLADGFDRVRRGIDEAILEHDRAAVASALERCADAAFSRVGPEDAVALIGASTQMRTAFSYPHSPVEQRTVERVLERARQAGPPDALEAAMARGRAMTIEQALDLLNGVGSRLPA